MKALVLVKITSLETKEAYNLLKRLKPIEESYLVYGRYDAVLIIEANTLEEIRQIILSEIHSIPGVIETLPCLIVEDNEHPEGGIGSNDERSDTEGRLNLVKQNHLIGEKS